MPYVQTKMIGAYQVVVGFQCPTIDPIESAKVVDPLLAETDIFKRFVQLKNELGAAQGEKIAIWADWKKITVKTSPQWRECERKYRAVEDKIREIQAQLAHQSNLLEEKRRQLLESNAVRFTIRGCEEIDEATCNDLQTKFRTRAPSTYLLFNGTTLIDKIGTKYWTKPADKWIETEITELGVDVPVDAYLWDDLTKEQTLEIFEQQETERIAALTTEDRAEEKNTKIILAKRKAGALKGEYEIEGRLDPLGDAQAWYSDRVAEIEATYADPV
ncbi:MAG: hypothetical protein GWN94_26485 [Phycisphaerae bacterium]|nr:hypothetical protein [Phycisphaerae bacterium]